MPRSRFLLAAVVGLLVLSACSSGSKTGPKADPTPTTWSLSYAGSTPVRLAAQAWGSAYDGTTLLIGYSDRSRGGTDRVGTVDLTTGKRTELARLSYPGGQITGAVRTGDWVAYGEESSRGRNTPGSALWRIVARGPHGQQRVLATSGGRKVTMSPDLTTVDGVAEWSVYPSLKTFGWKPGQKAPRREDVAPGDAVECTPPAPEPELVDGCVARDGWVAWTEKADPATEISESDDPAHLFYAKAGGPRQKLADLDAVDTSPEIFRDYLLWDSGHGINVTSLDHPSATVGVANSADIVSFRADDGSAAVIRQTGRGTTAQVVSIDDLHLTSR